MSQGQRTGRGADHVGSFWLEELGTVGSRERALSRGGARPHLQIIRSTVAARWGAA